MFSRALAVALLALLPACAPSAWQQCARLPACVAGGGFSALAAVDARFDSEMEAIESRHAADELDYRLQILSNQLEALDP